MAEMAAAAAEAEAEAAAEAAEAELPTFEQEGSPRSPDLAAPAPSGPAPISVLPGVVRDPKTVDSTDVKSNPLSNKTH
jgi:hypothetical protein